MPPHTDPQPADAPLDNPEARALGPAARGTAGERLAHSGEGQASVRVTPSRESTFRWGPPPVGADSTPRAADDGTFEPPDWWIACPNSPCPGPQCYQCGGVGHVNPDYADQIESLLFQDEYLFSEFFHLLMEEQHVTQSGANAIRDLGDVAVRYLVAWGKEGLVPPTDYDEILKADLRRAVEMLEKTLACAREHNERLVEMLDEAREEVRKARGEPDPAEAFAAAVRSGPPVMACGEGG